MLVYLTSELSWGIDDKFTPIFPYTPIIKDYLLDKYYGGDLSTVYIGMICESANSAALCKSRKPKYNAEKSKYLYQGVQVERDRKSLSYDFICNYDEYKMTEDIKPIDFNTFRIADRNDEIFFDISVLDGSTRISFDPKQNSAEALEKHILALRYETPMGLRKQYMQA